MTLDEVRAVLNARRKVYEAKKAKWEAREDRLDWIEEIVNQEHTLTALDYLEHEFEVAFAQRSTPTDVTPA